MNKDEFKAMFRELVASGEIDISISARTRSWEDDVVFDIDVSVDNNLIITNSTSLSLSDFKPTTYGWNSSG